MTERRIFRVAMGLLILLLLITAASAEGYREYRQAHGHIENAKNTYVLTAAECTDLVNASILDDGTLSTEETGYAEWTLDVEEDAWYTVGVCYFPGEGTGGDILRALSVNGEVPYSETADLAFSRMWNDKDRNYKSVSGNQPFPSQVQTPEWRTKLIEDAEGYVREPLRILLSKGQNTIRLTSLSESMIIKSITLAPPAVLPTYDEYIEKALLDGITYADVEPQKYQAEDAYLKSSPSFYPVNDRTSPLSEPYHPTYITLNCIGDTAWNEPGEWIEWRMDAPEDGLYRLIVRFKQSALRGLYAARRLTVNGEIPFEEAKDIRFYHDSSFQLKALGANRTSPQNEDEVTREYWLRLNKGTNIIGLEVTLGEIGEILSDMDAVTAQLNNTYRSIIAITSTNPDIYQSYQLYRRIPTLKDELSGAKEKLNIIFDRLTALTGSGSERTAGVTRLLSMMDELMQNEEQLVRRLSAFKECITAMGKSVLDFKDQPMKIDYFILAGQKNPKSMKGDGNFFDDIGHTFESFIGSFYNDYTVADSALGGDKKTIDVWISTGRDQFEVIRRLINESFEPVLGVKVNLKLISADVLLPSTFTGRGPDIALQIGNTAPVNFAFRDSALDLKQFDDYDEVVSHFLPAAMESFYFEGGCYALPDQMSFPVMFYRKDILDELGLEAPETWDDLLSMIPELQRYNMDLYLDTAPPATLGAALSMGNSVPVNTVFLSRLYQTGGDLYNENASKCMLASEEGNAAFKWWTQFYTQHGFPREIDFVTRFRLGEVPLGVVDLSTYTRLAVSAPEIRGAWAIAPVPGTRLSDGSVVRAVPCVTGASMIIKNTVEQKGTHEEAWSFLKWWTSGETQTHYAQEMEAILGQAGRYLVANLDAFDTIRWDLHTKSVLNEALKTLRGIPQVPGGYITGRYLNNAFVTVITNYENPADTLFEYTEMINEEISAKRSEFGLELAE